MILIHAGRGKIPCTGICQNTLPYFDTLPVQDKIFAVVTTAVRILAIPTNINFQDAPDMGPGGWYAETETCRHWTTNHEDGILCHIDGIIFVRTDSNRILARFIGIVGSHWESGCQEYFAKVTLIIVIKISCCCSFCVIRRDFIRRTMIVEIVVLAKECFKIKITVLGIFRRLKFFNKCSWFLYSPIICWCWPKLPRLRLTFYSRFSRSCPPREWFVYLQPSRLQIQHLAFQLRSNIVWPRPPKRLLLFIRSSMWPRRLLSPNWTPLPKWPLHWRRWNRRSI